MEQARPADPLRTLAIAQIATGIGIFVFWLLFFTVGLAPAKPPPCFFAFEHSFPLPDSVLAIGLIAGGLNVLGARTWGPAVSLASAGGLLFLGLIDFSFTAQNGGFSGPIADAAMSGAISLWVVVLGIWIVRVYGAEFMRATSSES